MTNISEGRVSHFSKKGGAFYIEFDSKKLQAQTVDWPVRPKENELVRFVVTKVDGKDHVLPAPHTAAAAQERKLDLGACIGEGDNLSSSKREQPSSVRVEETAQKTAGFGAFLLDFLKSLFGRGAIVRS